MIDPDLDCFGGFLGAEGPRMYDLVLYCSVLLRIDVDDIKTCIARKEAATSAC